MTDTNARKGVQTEREFKNCTLLCQKERKNDFKTYPSEPFEYRLPYFETVKVEQFFEKET